MPAVTEFEKPKPKPRAKKPKAEPAPPRSSEFFVTTDLKACRCPRCPGVILLQGDSGGFKVTLETTSLTLAEELEVRATGKPTYELYDDRSNLRADYRSFIHIQHDITHKKSPLVVATHQCERKTL